MIYVFMFGIFVLSGFYLIDLISLIGFIPVVIMFLLINVIWELLDQSKKDTNNLPIIKKESTKVLTPNKKNIYKVAPNTNIITNNKKSITK